MDVIGSPDRGSPPPQRFAAFVCAVIGHRPDAPPLWNHGHGFAACLRCERAIVRTIVHGWRLPPQGYRIRWPEREEQATFQSSIAQPLTSESPIPRSRTPQSLASALREPVLDRSQGVAREVDSDFMEDSPREESSAAFHFDDFFTERSPDPTLPKRRLPR